MGAMAGRQAGSREVRQAIMLFSGKPGPGHNIGNGNNSVGGGSAVKAHCKILHLILHLNKHIPIQMNQH